MPPQVHPHYLPAPYAFGSLCLSSNPWPLTPYTPPLYLPSPPPLTLTPRPGIKKPKQQRYRNTKGVDPKFLRNQRYVTQGVRAKVLAGETKA
jgi:hypothetical protein